MQKNIVYYKDARGMAEVDDNSIALIVTSPPYWNIKDYSLNGRQEEARTDLSVCGPDCERTPVCVRTRTGRRSSGHVQAGKLLGQIGDIQNYRQYLHALNAVWKECERVLQPNGKLCVNAPLVPILKKNLNTHHTRDILNLYTDIEHEILKQTKLYLMDVYIWNRTNPTKRLIFGSYPYPPNFYAQNTVEFIGIFVKDGRPLKRTEEIKEASKLTQEEWVNFTKQVWDIPIPNKSDVAYGEHPAIMPFQIACRLIQLYSFVKDIVLDPFMGSGTTAKAALQTKRHYIGYEINLAYKRIIEAKLEQFRNSDEMY